MMTLPFTVDHVIYFFLIFVRIITILAMMPIFGSESVPLQIKIALGLILATILSPFIGTNSFPPLQQFSPIMFGLLIIKEVMVGIAVGFIASLLFTAIQFAGRLVDNEMGFGFVELVDPFTSEMVTVWGQLQVIVFTIIFLLFNGHYFLLLAIQRSFELVPLLSAQLPGEKVAFHLVALTGSLFEIALKFAAPIYVPLILTEVALGAVARTVPQINIFFVGMPIKIVMGLYTAALVLPMLTVLFRTTFEKLIQDIWRLLFLMA
jgi:flagellar biosynthesis protein FliR